MTYRILYIPRGINAPRPRDMRAAELAAVNPRHAAVRAQSFERRSGARVLTIMEVRQ